MKELIEGFIEFKKSVKREGTSDYYTEKGLKMIDVLTELDLLDYSEYDFKTIIKIIKYFRSKTNSKNTTINKHLEIIYFVLNHFEIKTNLPKKYKLEDDTKHFKPLRDEDIPKLFEYLELNKHDYNLVIYLMLDTGVRWSEFKNINYNDIDFKNKRILLSHTKNHKKRYCFFSDKTSKLLKEVGSDYFSNINYNNLRNLYLKIKKAKNIKVLHSHCLRKTFATQLYKNGCPIPSIQQYLGHESILQTMVYLEIDIAILDDDYIKYYPF